MTAAIEIKNLEQSYGKHIVLQNISLRMPKGEILGLLGPSGSGKTTLVRSIMGMLSPKKGKITVLGHDIPNRQLLAKIGYMAQSDALYATLTARDNLNFFANLMGIRHPKEAIDHAARVVNLTDYLDRRVQDYSGGMKRRLSLAIALVPNPELLILDEPTVGIDPELRRQIWRELHQLSAQGTTILITTHVMEDAEECTQLLLIRDGQEIAQGTPAELKKQYDEPTVEAVFIKAGQEAEGEN